MYPELIHHGFMELPKARNIISTLCVVPLFSLSLIAVISMSQPKNVKYTIIIIFFWTICTKLLLFGYLSPKSPGAKYWSPRLCYWEVLRTFRRWSLVGDPWVTGNELLKGILRTWILPVSFLASWLMRWVVCCGWCSCHVVPP